MKLTRLELSGFKSFADTVTLPFEEGVTSIVGPNGCGKSNISDAVRWVLGEQRVRLLRGAKMEDVIFQGSAKRRPINIAEVSIYLDNGDNTLAVAYEEVVVTRRLSRHGQSEYLLNGTPVRLRDVQDLLQGTGLGSDAGVVIEAEMIDRLLSDRPDERRSLFEEAAGIGLYRDRKISTERRLEKTSEDLRRLDDIIAEVQTQVRSLARQRGKAERHEKFTRERFAIVMTLTRRETASMDEQDADLRSRQTELAARIPQARQSLRDMENEREECMQARATAEARRSELERRLAETRIEIERLEGDLNLAGERLENAQGRRTRAMEERQQADERAAQAQREQEAAGAERSAAQSARQSVQMELDLRSATEDETRNRLAAHRSVARDTAAARQRQAEIVRALAGERTAIEHDLEELRARAKEADDRREETAREFDASRQQLEVARAELETRQSEEQEAATELERARHNLAAAREHEAAVRVERRAAEEKIAQRGARREALEELEREREGLAPAARELLRTRERFGEAAILGPLSDYVSTSQSQAQVAERLLAEWLHAVLVTDEAAVSAVKRWHAEVKPGPLVLLPVSPGPAQRGAEIGIAELSVKAPAEEWVASLLAGARVDDEGHAVRRPNGAIYLGTVAAGGPLSRRAEMETLRSDLEVAERQLDELKRGTSRAADAYAEAERSLESAAAEAESARASLREAQGASDDASRRLHRSEREKTETAESHERLSQRIEERSARLHKVEGELAASEQEGTRLDSDLERHRAELAELDAAQEAARERRVHWQVEEAQVSAREQAAREREARAQQALTDAREKMAALEREMSTIEDDTRGLTEHRAQWEDTLAERRMAVQELEVAAQQASQSVLRTEADVTRIEESMGQAREELDVLNENAHRIEVRLTESSGRRQTLVERIEVEWHQPVSELLVNVTEVEGETEELRQEAERLERAIEALGPVNPLALQEHAEEAKRLQFLQEQRDDLVEARKTLLQALREIDKTAREMFVETFARIRENFGAVFQTLFEGGQCDVRLTDDEDPLASTIEIYAAPRGKRTQRIHLLSSGERALVALSLLFSIYLTKPAPFCLLDEVDAPLDDANVTRFVHLLDEFKTDTQFIVITHNPRTMQVADAVYGVTMQEPGVSTIVGVRLGEAATVAS